MQGTPNNQFSRREFANQPDDNQPSENQASQDINRGHAASLLSQIKSSLELEPHNITRSIIMPAIVTFGKSIILFNCMKHLHQISLHCAWLTTITETGKDESNLPTVCISEMCISHNPSVYSEYRNWDCDGLISKHLGTVYEDPNKSCNMNGENSLNNHSPGAISALIASCGIDAMTQLILNIKAYNDSERGLAFLCYNFPYALILFLSNIHMQDENITHLKPNQEYNLNNDQRWLAGLIECVIKENETYIPDGFKINVFRHFHEHNTCFFNCNGISC